MGQNYLNSWIAQHITFDMRNKMYAHLQQMSQRFFTTNNQGDIITRMTSDIGGVQSVITGTFTSILSNSITLIAALAVMYQRNWMLATLGVLVIPLFVLPSRRAGKTRWELTRESQACSDEINGILNETLSVSGQMLVKLFGKEQYEYDRYKDANSRMIRLNIKESMAGRWFFMVISVFSSIGPMLLYLVGGILMMQYGQDLTVGDITVMVSLLGRMYGPVNQLLNIQVEWIRSMALFTRIFEYFDLPVEIQNAPDAVTPSSADGSVAFQHVNFSYDPERQILHDVSFSLRAGHSIAIVGPSGFREKHHHQPDPPAVRLPGRGGAVRRNGREKARSVLPAPERGHRKPGNVSLQRHHPGKPALRQARRYGRRTDRRLQKSEYL